MYKPGAHINVTHMKDGSASFDSHYGKNPLKCCACHGTGKKINFKIGLGQSGLVPAYTDDTCEVCGGSGNAAVHNTDSEHIHYEYNIPDSFILWLWEKWTNR